MGSPAIFRGAYTKLLTSLGLRVESSQQVDFFDGSGNKTTLNQGSVSGNTTFTLPPNNGSSGQVLKTNGSGVTSWAAAGTGDFAGPASSTDNAIVRFDGTGGKTGQNSGVTIDDSDNIAGAASINFGDDSLSNYDEGTWTASESSKTNLTGTGTFNTETYTRIGRVVHCYIQSITGYTITTAGNRTFLAISSSGLPGLVNATEYFGGAFCFSNSRLMPAAITQESTGNQNIVVEFNTADGANSTSVSILSVFFSYTI